MVPVHGLANKGAERFSEKRTIHLFEQTKSSRSKPSSELTMLDTMPQRKKGIRVKNARAATRLMQQACVTTERSVSVRLNY